MTATTGQINTLADDSGEGGGSWQQELEADAQASGLDLDGSVASGSDSDQSEFLANLQFAQNMVNQAGLTKYIDVRSENDGKHGVFNCYQIPSQLGGLAVSNYAYLGSIVFDATDPDDIGEKLEEASDLVTTGVINDFANDAATVMGAAMQVDLAILPGPTDVLLGAVATKAIAALAEKTGVTAIFQAGKYIFQREGAPVARAEVKVLLKDLRQEMVAAGNWESFETFGQLKNAWGAAGTGYNWHHIVEQSQTGRFGAAAIQCTENVIKVTESVNRQIAAIYSSIREDITGSATMTVRGWLRTQTYQECRAFGIEALQNVESGVW